MISKDPFKKSMFQISKPKCFLECSDAALYQSFLHENSVDYSKLVSLKFVNYNDIQYREGLFLIDTTRVMEILKILKTCDEKIIFICSKYIVTAFDDFLNSIEILLHSPKELLLIEFSQLKNKITYQKYIVDSKLYVIADTLNVYNDFP